MPRKRYSPEQIITKLRQAELELSRGLRPPQICKKLVVSEQTHYRWRKEYGGLRLDQAKRLKTLEQENARLKRLVADQALDNAILKAVAAGNFCARRDDARPWIMYDTTWTSRNGGPVGYWISRGRREGLKVPQKQPKRGRLWLTDGSCIRRRAEYRHHVWAYDFVAGRTHDGRPLKILTVVDEYSRECLALVVARRLRATDVLETLRTWSSRTGSPPISARTTVRSSRRSSSGCGSRHSKCRRCSSSRAARGRTAMWNHSTENCGMNCSTGRSSTR